MATPLRRPTIPILAGSPLLPPGSPDSLPPTDEDAENYVLACLFRDPTRKESIRKELPPEDFWDDDRRDLYECLCEQIDSGIKPDPVTLRDALTKGRGMTPNRYTELVAEILNSEHLWGPWGFQPEPENAVLHAKKLHDLATKRSLIEHHTHQLRLLYADLHDVNALVDLGRERIAEIEAIAAPSSDLLPVESSWPKPLGDAAWRCKIGDLVHIMAPHTESDPVAIFIQFLVAFGNVLGRKAHWIEGVTKHFFNLFCVIVGNTGKARKGSGWTFSRFCLSAIDPEWNNSRVIDGLQSGQGLVGSVRDGRRISDDVIDSGVTDKRALLIEEEFAGILAPMNNTSNALGKQMSAIIRKFWSGGDQSLTKLHAPIRTTGAHVSIIGHITFDELRKTLPTGEVANGFANRFLWVCARRARKLSSGGAFHTVDLAPYVAWMRTVVDFIDMLNSDHVYRLTPQAAEYWDPIYNEISDPPPGVVGNMLARAEAQVLRLALLYAVLDRKWDIDVPHIDSALAIWRYCHESVVHIFGGDNDTESNKILTALRGAKEGLTRTELIRQAFGNQITKDELNKLLSDLIREHRIVQAEETRQRKVVVYRIMA